VDRFSRGKRDPQEATPLCYCMKCDCELYFSEEICLYHLKTVCELCFDDLLN